MNPGIKPKNEAICTCFFDCDQVLNTAVYMSNVFSCQVYSSFFRNTSLKLIKYPGYLRLIDLRTRKTHKLLQTCKHAECNKSAQVYSICSKGYSENYNHTHE